MREINTAYRLILESSAISPRTTHPTTGPQPAPPRRLTRDEIDRMIQAIGTAGPIETTLDAFRAAGTTIKNSLVAIVLVLISARLLRALIGRDWTAIRNDPRILIYPLFTLACILGWYWQRRHQDEL